jgi:hypothetical protein
MTSPLAHLALLLLLLLQAVHTPPAFLGIVYQGLTIVHDPFLFRVSPSMGRQQKPKPSNQGENPTRQKIKTRKERKGSMEPLLPPAGSVPFLVYIIQRPRL